ncbi:RNase H family protein [Psychrobacter sp. CAL346-MNA-CIBAN-0220]|uniref:RNase H family protein n=1 Tax=Psychrobacter sp. CAL346-MNA-CIBAN-0220 TaxID=3140457 RepID=UPI00331E42C0
MFMIYNEHEKKLSQGYKLTTNNRMEMLGAIVALEVLTRPCVINITTDSQYLKQGI